MGIVLSIIKAATILLWVFVVFFAGRIYELRRQNKKVLEKELENLKLTEEVLWLHRLAASESATEKPEAGTTADKGGKFEKSKRADDPRK